LLGGFAEAVEVLRARRQGDRRAVIGLPEMVATPTGRGVAEAAHHRHFRCAAVRIRSPAGNPHAPP